MKHGFKAHATRFALEVRSEVGLDAYALLDPRLVTEKYGIPVYCVRDMECSPEVHEYFASDTHKVSAMLVPHPNGRSRMILENDWHTEARRTNSIAHEIAHVLLEHSFKTALLSADGCHESTSDVEQEATHLGAEMLIPTKAAHRWASLGHSNMQVAQHHGVSLELATMRMNASGARKRAAHAQSRRA